MNCKNCGTLLADDAHFCHHCGAKVVTERAHTLELIKGFFLITFNWDNSYIKTFRDLFSKPQVVIEAYISGVRKKYVPPIVFLAVMTAFGTLLYNAYSDEYINISSNLNDAIFEIAETYNKTNSETKIFDKEKLNQDSRETQRQFLKYFNVFTFLSIPLSAFMSFLVFGWKKFNFAEHVIINSYLQGLGLFFGSIAFVIGIFTTQRLSILQGVFLLFYYFYTYTKLLNLSLGKVVLKILLFIALFVGLFIVLSVIIGILGFVYGLNL